MKGIKYISESNPTGYGRAARGYLRGLENAGIPLTWLPMVVGNSWGMYLEPLSGQSDDPEVGKLANRVVDYDTVIVHQLPNFYPHWRRREPGKRLVGMTVWETTRLPDGWLDLLHSVDALIVPTEWNRQAFLNAGVKRPIGVIPHILEATGVGDSAADSPATTVEIPGVAKSDFVFYTIGNWFERKGMHLTLESYLRAFHSDDPVVLVIKTGPTDERHRRYGHFWWHILRRFQTTSRATERLQRKHKSPPRVVLLPDLMSAEQIRALHRRGDCFVSLTRTEGWGLGAFEAASFGNPVIMTGFGGQLAFLPPDLANLVDYRLIPADPKGAIEKEAYTAEHEWAEPDLDHGASLMRKVYENQSEAKRRATQLRASLHHRYDEQKLTRELLSFLESV